MPSQGPRPFILLVEDSEDDAFFFQAALRRSGYEHDLVKVMDGESAVRFLDEALQPGKRRPDLVFLDLKLPGLNGFEVLTWLSARGLEPPLDVTVLSGSEHASDVTRAHALGAARYIVKPIKVEGLRPLLEAWRAERANAPSSIAAASLSPPTA